MNSVFTQYEELLSPQFAVINLSLRLRLITANFGLDNSSYRAQPHSIIANNNLCIKLQSKISKIRLKILMSKGPVINYRGGGGGGLVENEGGQVFSCMKKGGGGKNFCAI